MQSLRIGAASTHFNPRSLGGERPASFAGLLLLDRISIHAPRAGSDFCQHNVDQFDKYFNPRSLCGERQRMNSFTIPL